jgi:hypothetical protein
MPWWETESTGREGRQRGMSQQRGRGGMGSHKHGISGHSGQGASLQMTARFLNREAEKKRKTKESKKNLVEMHGNVREVFKRK